MTAEANPSGPIEWYLAPYLVRYEYQYGPISDADMREFGKLGHLHASDLLWRKGFADWAPASAVFDFPGTSGVTAAPPDQMPTAADASAERSAQLTEAPRQGAVAVILMKAGETETEAKDRHYGEHPENREATEVILVSFVDPKKRTADDDARSEIDAV